MQTACMLNEELVRALLLMFIAVDPLGNAPLFYAVTSAMPVTVRRAVIKRSVEAAFLILLLFASVGDTLLYYFGLTLADFRIAGGIILLIYGIAGILGQSEATMIREPEEAESLDIVPLATPLLAGPAAIATVLYVKAVAGLIIALISIIINTAITYAMLINSDTLIERIGKNGSIALTKIMAILLTAIAIAMIRGGIEEIARSTP
jgi:multiple antibiotic resistance protein